MDSSSILTRISPAATQRIKRKRVVKFTISEEEDDSSNADPGHILAKIADTNLETSHDGLIAPPARRRRRSSPAGKLQSPLEALDSNKSLNVHNLSENEDEWESDSSNNVIDDSPPRQHFVKPGSSPNKKKAEKVGASREKKTQIDILGSIPPTNGYNGDVERAVSQSPAQQVSINSNYDNASPAKLNTTSTKLPFQNNVDKSFKKKKKGDVKETPDEQPSSTATLSNTPLAATNSADPSPSTSLPLRIDAWDPSISKLSKCELIHTELASKATAKPLEKHAYVSLSFGLNDNKRRIPTRTYHNLSNNPVGFPSVTTGKFYLPSGTEISFTNVVKNTMMQFLVTNSAGSLEVTIASPDQDIEENTLSVEPIDGKRNDQEEENAVGEVSYTTSSFQVHVGDHFYIPQKNYYRIFNKGKVEATLFYTLIEHKC